MLGTSAYTAGAACTPTKCAVCLRILLPLLALTLVAGAQSPLPDSFNPGATASFPNVAALAVQADGKILVGGYFIEDGQVARGYIGRLKADGTLDTSFNAAVGGINPYVRCLALQADGQILVGGLFTSLSGQSCTNIGRLDANGTLDTNFNPRPNASVNSLALQADGKILLGGFFNTLNGQKREKIGRLNADGTLDANFNPGAGGSYPYVNSLALLEDGKILAGGGFTSLAGQSRNRIGRLNVDGTLDTNFNPGADNSVFCLALQADGKIVVGGQFNSLGGQSRNCIGRLNADGAPDTNFNPGAGGINPFVRSLALQADGSILVGGNFTTLGGQSRNSIGRLKTDGTPDANFNPPADGAFALAVQVDGKILVGGKFNMLGGQDRTNIGRLHSSGPAVERLTFDASTLTWTRGGTSPEVWHTTFEYSPDGGNPWTILGEGSRIRGLLDGQAGGWQLSGVALPPNTTFRARGYTVGGIDNSSSWFVETVLRPPIVISNFLYSANGAFRFSAQGPAGQVVVIETSLDLGNWTPLQTNTLGADPLPFTDSQLADLPSRFYRLRSVP